MVYHFEVHREKHGYWAACLELKGCLTDADSLEQLRRNAHEALNLYLDEPKDSTVVFPLPRRYKVKGIMEVSVEPDVALSVLLRSYRSRKGMTQKEVALKLGMKNLYSYQRLERRANPSLNTLRKLKQAFPDLSVDYLLQATGA